MKIKCITILGLLFFIGCSKSSIELFELSKEKLKNSNTLYFHFIPHIKSRKS